MNDKKRIKLLEQNYAALYEHLQDLEASIERLETEHEYMTGFISYHHLEKTYLYFKENAHWKSDPDLPFPSLTLDEPIL